jgi:hypothetical protein
MKRSTTAALARLARVHHGEHETRQPDMVVKEVTD